MRRLAGRRRRRWQLCRAGGGLARPRRRARDPAPPPRRSARDDVRLPDPRARRASASPSATAARSPRSTERTDNSRPSRSRAASSCRSRAVFFFLGAAPCTEWLDDAVARDADGFILTGEAAGADNLLETSVPGIFAAGDVRSGSSKRCAAAVGEGSMAVQFVHQHLAPPDEPESDERASAPTSIRSRVHELPAAVDGCEDCLREGTQVAAPPDLPHLRSRRLLRRLARTATPPRTTTRRRIRSSAHSSPARRWSWCYIDEVAFILEDVRGTTQIPPSPLLS